VSERPFSQGPGPWVVAHRGASAGETENTLQAFDRAIATGADAVEFDVRLTADGAVVVIHDADVARITDGTGLVSEMTLGEIGSLTIALRDGGSTRVPTLEEALRRCSGRIAVDIEIKNIPGEPGFDAERELAVEATLEAIDAGFDGDVLISSFNPRSLARSLALAPQIPTGLLTDYSVPAAVAADYAEREGHLWVLPYLEQVRDAGPSVAEAVHAAGMRLGTWITDDPAVAVELMRAGVDAVATNDPAAVVEARRAAGLG
jgi:glycerophosphoryl diester phosphodiesterase